MLTRCKKFVKKRRSYHPKQSIMFIMAHSVDDTLEVAVIVAI